MHCLVRHVRRASGHVQATGNVDGLASHKACFRRGKVEGKIGNFLGGAQSPHRRHSHLFLVDFAGDGANHRCFDAARHYGIDPDSEGSEFCGKMLRKADQGRFRCGIVAGC